MPSAQCREHGPPQAQAAPVPPVEKPSVKFPRDGDIFRLDPQTPRAAQALFLKSSVPEGEIVWRVDSRELSERGPSVAWALEPGRHRVYFTLMRDGKPLKSDSVRFMVVK